jgi:tetratricopeptide (TPR) repeat protein
MSEQTCDIGAAFESAEGCFERGDFQGALDGYLALLTERLRVTQTAAVSFTSADLFVVERLADLALLYRRLQAADELLAGMAELCLRNRNVFSADYATLKRVQIALARSKIVEAFNLLNSMEGRIGSLDSIDFTTAGLQQWEEKCIWPDAQDADRSFMFSRLYLVMGRLLSSLGQYGQGTVALSRGLTHCSRDNWPEELVVQTRTSLELALIMSFAEKGELDEALRRLNLLPREWNGRNQPGFYVTSLELRAKVHMLRGALGEAKSLLEEVLTFCRARQFTEAAQSARLNLAQMLILLNQTSTAEKLLLEAKEISRVGCDPIVLQRAECLLQLSDARSASLAEGIPLAPTVTDMWGSGKRAEGPAQTSSSARTEDPIQTPFELPQAASFLSFFEDRVLAFQWLLSRQAVEKASQFLEEVKQTFGASDSAIIEGRLSSLSGMLAYYQGRYPDAEDLLLEARGRLTRLGLVPDLWQAQRILGWCYAKQGRSEAEQRQLAEESQSLLARMAEALPPDDRAIFNINKWTTEEEWIAGRIDELVAIKKAVARRAWWGRAQGHFILWRRLDILLRHIDSFRHIRAERTMDLGEPGSREKRVLPLWRRLLFHPLRRVTVSFLVLPDRVLIARLGWLSLDFAVAPMTRLRLRTLVRRWHELVRDIPVQPQPLSRLSMSGNPPMSGAGDIRDIRRKARGVSAWSEAAFKCVHVADELGAELLIPELLQTLPRRIHAITVVADDSLHGFPFSALRFGDGYLIERYAVSFGIETFPATKTGVRTQSARRACIVGVSRGTESLPPLPGVIRELAIVDECLSHNGWQVQVLRDNDADVTSVLRLVPHVRLMHLACHGTFAANRPDQSGLVLLSKDKGINILTARTLSETNFVSVDHMTLSSCWAADHFVLPGRWVIGLPEVLQRAGVKSVLGCLWPVNDRTSVAFMNQFYKNLMVFPRDEALRRTQLDCLKLKLQGCEDLDTTGLSHWAGYGLYGTPNRL